MNRHSKAKRWRIRELTVVSGACHFAWREILSVYGLWKWIVRKTDKEVDSPTTRAFDPSGIEELIWSVVISQHLMKRPKSSEVDNKPLFLN